MKNQKLPSPHPKPSSALAKIMRPHAKSEAVQKRQSALLLEFADNDAKHIAALLQEWLKDKQ
ncbi:hypothetical protein ISG33_04140 [Glaciecola sp. MH2013]|uniref:hypothetical protein n=1 Tax=Glaciecola sp. MH2013 TaxID=2785524 RepID=UPI00189E4AA7|nr:hypothetical protein [Glaciecola sp. MH2013]MBF7072587.1 hypothetical protein [Glaciecola sp. MH2013]